MSQPAPTTPVQDLYVQARRDTSLASISASIGWLGTMILSVKAIAAGADFVPLPYLRAACSTVVILLETVDKIKKNRDALKDLCASMVEIVFILREAILAHWEVAAAHFVGLCETFIAYLRVLKDGLEKLINSRQGIRGRFREILGATSIADQIERYKDRMNELRLNFMVWLSWTALRLNADVPQLMATLETNVNVAGIRENLSVSQNPPCFLEGIGRFRNLLLGDINLISETPMKSKIKIFTARIAGEPSIMTVAKYENDEDKWRRDLRLYSSLRHPNVWQLFGVSTAPILRALISHDELIPLPIYRQYFRPTSDLAWACIEAMLFKQFLAAAEYHRWKTEEHPDQLSV
ncbi:hypothetical protein C8R43DRAFT_315936 [Mycena crocata]|nr:hypothetical protein C8R43DRAFT_315936 [Mycena crocata]